MPFIYLTKIKKHFYKLGYSSTKQGFKKTQSNIINQKVVYNQEIKCLDLVKKIRKKFCKNYDNYKANGKQKLIFELGDSDVARLKLSQFIKKFQNEKGYDPSETDSEDEDEDVDVIRTSDKKTINYYEDISSDDEYEIISDDDDENDYDDYEDQNFIVKDYIHNPDAEYIDSQEEDEIEDLEEDEIGEQEVDETVQENEETYDQNEEGNNKRKVYESEDTDEEDNNNLNYREEKRRRLYY